MKMAEVWNRQRNAYERTNLDENFPLVYEIWRKKSSKVVYLRRITIQNKVYQINSVICHNL